MVKFTKKEIIDFQMTNNLNSTVSYILSKLNVEMDNVPQSKLTYLKTSLRVLKSKRDVKFKAACRIKKRFESKNVEWLNSEFSVPIHNTQHPVSSSQIGRPLLEFYNKSDRSKRREVTKISNDLKHDPVRMIMACRYAAKQTSNSNLYTVLGSILKNPNAPNKINESSISIRMKTAQEALAFLFDNSLSKEVYQNIRMESKLCGADIWPPYNVVRAAKAECRPPRETVSISEKKAETTVQSLLNHTAERIVNLQAEVVTQHLRNEGVTVIEAIMICSWGFDGSSGFACFKQNYESAEDNTPQSDQNVFITTIIPLRLSTASNIILWNNNSSQSPRSCRPLSIEYTKESTDIVLKQKRNVETQIDKLNILEIMLDDEHSIRIHFSLFLTLIDGKVLNIITGTKSMQSCPICHATPKMFNTLQNKENDIFLPDPKSLQYGISPLHAWIRIFETCLHISYRININVWQMRDQKHKAEFAERKQLVQQVLWEKLGLIVDKPKPGGAGSTNDGNTARRAFENPELFAQCLNLDPQLLCNFKTILIALSCHLPINPHKFEILCDSTAEIYIKNYNWYPMSSTLHKILMHGADVMRHSILPVGMLAEEASESRNKDYKNYRKFHSRTLSRTANIEDIFFRAMDSTDPVISAINLESRKRKKKILKISSEVRELLADSQEVEDDENTQCDYDNQNNYLPGVSETFNLLNTIELSEDYEN